MSEVEAAYIANALAEGQHLTEGDFAEFLHAADGSIEHQERDAYIEILELAVLKTCLRNNVCQQCGQSLIGSTIDHTPDCIVPALLAKYEDD